MPFFGNEDIRDKMKQLKNILQEGKAINNTLRANQKAFINFISLNSFLRSFISLFHQIQKRVSVSVSSFCKGSMTVEAALVFPVFIILVVNLLSVLDFIRLQSAMTAALHQTGKKLSVYGYAYDKAGLKLEDYPLSSAMFSYTYIKDSVEKYLGKEYLEHTVLEQGNKGIYYGYSKIMEADRIDIVTLYNVNGLFSGRGIWGVPMYSRFYGHVWNGYDVEKAFQTDEGDIYVFVTKSGNVYHRNRNCTYLNPSVEAVYYEEVEKRRNESGGVFYECELCDGKKGNVVYITKQGNRYHTTLECSGLKRTVYSVLLSEAGRPPCSKCGP